MTAACDQETTVLTGVSLHNLASAARKGLRCKRWVGEGGYAVAGSVLPASGSKGVDAQKSAPSWSEAGGCDAVLSILSASPQAIPQRVLVPPSWPNTAGDWEPLWREGLASTVRQGTSLAASPARAAALELLIKARAPQGPTPLLLAVAIVLEPACCAFTEPMELFPLPCQDAPPISGSLTLVQGVPLLSKDAALDVTSAPALGIPLPHLVRERPGRSNAVAPLLTDDDEMRHAAAGAPAALGVPVGSSVRWASRLCSDGGASGVRIALPAPHSERRLVEVLFPHS